MTTLAALDTDDGHALAGEVTELLESELVRFTHRVHHDHGVELDRARAALVLLTTLVRGGVGWTPRSDCAPARVAAAFAALAARDPSPARELADALAAEVDAFTAATAGTATTDPPVRATADLLRRAGAAPETWWWASSFGANHAGCWKACATSSERLVQVALALGVNPDPIARAIAGAFTVAATRAKTRRTAQRNDLVALLGKLAAAGAVTLERDRDLVAKATALAFEMAASQQPWWSGAAPGERKRTAADGIAEVAVLSFQLVELFTAIAGGRPPDPERYGALAGRADRALTSRGLRLGAMLQHELDPVVAAAVAVFATPAPS